MPSEQPTNVLYIGHDKAFLSSIVRVLQFHQNKYKLEKASSLKEIKNSLDQNNYHAFLFDAELIKTNGNQFYENILDFAKKIPLVLLVDEKQERIAEDAVKSGVFDYIVKVEGAVTAIPFTLDRAKEQNVSTKNIAFDFQVESTLSHITSFFEINESGRFISFDDNLQNILGLSSSEFYKTYLMDFIADEDREIFYQWHSSIEGRQDTLMIDTEVIHKTRGIIPVELQLTPYTRPEALFSGFRGYFKVLSKEESQATERRVTDIKPLFHELYQLNNYFRKNLIQLFHMKLAEIPKRNFKFGYASLFLYHTTKHQYQNEIEIGAKIHGDKTEIRSDFFTEKEVRKLFPRSEFVRFVHQSVLNETERKPGVELFQSKLWKEGNNWEKGDRLFINLRTSDENCLGFIILENPETGKTPSTQILERAEILSNYISGLYEFHTRFSKLENKHKHFKQIFTILETFCIDLPLENLLREIVWTIKLSLGYNLPILAIFSKSTHRLNLKSIALENKEKARILSRLHFSIEEIIPLLKQKCRISHSYLVQERNNPLNIIKRIYGTPITSVTDPKMWHCEDILLIPITTRKKKIIGFFILDDPTNKLRPYTELVQILEKIARLVAVTIENKLIYAKIKSDYQRLQLLYRSRKNSNGNKTRSGRIKEVLKRMNLS